MKVIISNLLEIVVEICGYVSRVLQLKFLGDNLPVPGNYHRLLRLGRVEVLALCYLVRKQGVEKVEFLSARWNSTKLRRVKSKTARIHIAQV